PAFIPAEYTMKPGEKQFWRLLNSAAVSILDLQLLYDGKPQPFEIISLDGVAIGSQNGSGKGSSLVRDHILIPPAGRAGFIVTGLSGDARNARLITRKFDPGPDGAPDPTRPLFHITASAAADPSIHGRPIPAASGPAPAPRFPNLDKATATVTRSLYFS